MLLADKVKALIFDFDGLILDTESSMLQTWREIYQEHGLEISLEKWAKILGQSADPPEAYEFLEAHIGEGINREELRKRRNARELAILQHEPAMPGVASLIRESKDSGLSLAIASSSEHAWVDEHLHRLGLLQDFDAIVCADDVEATKPSPELYLLALKRLEISPQEAIVFEDSQHGVTAARSAGIYCIAVPNAVTSAASFDKANRVLESLDGIRLEDILELASRA